MIGQCNIFQFPNGILPITNGGTGASTNSLARQNLGCKMDLLWGGSTTWSTGSITLSHPFTDYDLLIFVYSNTSESLASASSSYIFSTCYPTLFLSDCMDKGGYIATFGYSTRFRRYSITNTTTITNIRNGDAGETGMIAVYGLKCS